MASREALAWSFTPLNAGKLFLVLYTPVTHAALRPSAGPQRRWKQLLTTTCSPGLVHILQGHSLMSQLLK